MVKGLYTSWTGMLNEQNRMDILSNNLANADTAGYKKEGTTVHPFKKEMALKIKDTSTAANADELGMIYPGVKIGENYTDYAQGSFKVTDNSTDIALSGDGFFAIEFTNKAGEASVKYTRDGEFHVTTDGYLVTADGDYVLNQNAALAGATGAAGYIQLDPAQEITIDDFGNIFQDNTLKGQIGVVDFENYDYLSKYGENMYEMVDGGTRKASTATVEQGTLEMSNVNIVSEMVDLITITRAYESNQKAIQTINEMLEKSANNVSRV
jgi:flagellar basal-body rod protein FlgG